MPAVNKRPPVWPHPIEAASWERAHVKAFVNQVADFEGCLSKPTVHRLTDIFDFSRSTIYAMRTNPDDEQEVVGRPKDVDFFAYAAEVGSAAFDFKDEELLSMYYALVGNLSELWRQLTASPLFLDAEWNTTVPRYNTLWKRLDSATSQAVRDAARHGFKNRFKWMLILGRKAKQVNEWIEIDEVVLNQVAVLNGAETPVHAIVIVDAFSKFTQAYITPHAATKEDFVVALAEFLTVRRDKTDGRVLGGVPHSLVFDQGGAFRNDLVRQIASVLPAGFVFSIGYNPIQKGLVEVMNRVIEQRAVQGSAGRKSPVQNVDGTDALAQPRRNLPEYRHVVKTILAEIDLLNRTPKASLDDRAPRDVYGDPTLDRRDVDEALLGTMMIKPHQRNGGKRKVRPGFQIEVRKNRYVSPALHDNFRLGDEVYVHPFHHRNDIVAIYSNNKFVGLGYNVHLLDDDIAVLMLGKRQAEIALIYRLISEARKINAKVTELTGEHLDTTDPDDDHDHGSDEDYETARSVVNAQHERSNSDEDVDTTPGPGDKTRPDNGQAEPEVSRPGLRKDGITTSSKPNGSKAPTGGSGSPTIDQVAAEQGIDLGFNNTSTEPEPEPETSAA